MKVAHYAGNSNWKKKTFPANGVHDLFFLPIPIRKRDSAFGNAFRANSFPIHFGMHRRQALKCADSGC